MCIRDRYPAEIPGPSRLFCRHAAGAAVGSAHGGRAVLAAGLHPHPGLPTAHAKPVFPHIYHRKRLHAASHPQHRHHDGALPAAGGAAWSGFGHLPCGIRKARQPACRAGAADGRDPFGYPLHRLRAVRIPVFCHRLQDGQLAAERNPDAHHYDFAAHHAHHGGGAQVGA